jgi:hypothetical protein
MKNLINKLLGRSGYPYEQLEIRFHKQANPYGEHGTIVVTHVKQGLVEVPVRFVFVGVTTPPKLDVNTFLRIWEEAKAQGYIPHHFATYGLDNEIVFAGKPGTDTEQMVRDMTRVPVATGA